MQKIIIIFTLFFLLIITNSCALLFTGSKQKIQVNSTPVGANIFVNGENTGLVTPAEIKVKRRVKDSPTSTSKKMTYTLKKEGFTNLTRVDDSKVNGVIWANFIYPLGFVIDAMGGAYRKYPDSVHVSLIEGSNEPQKITPTTNDLTTKASGYAMMSIEELEAEKAKAIESEDYDLAKMLKAMIEVKQNKTTEATETTETNSTTPINQTTKPASNRRELIWQEMKNIDYASANNNNTISMSTDNLSNTTEAPVSTKLKNTEENEVAKNLKYRRSSLYTLMINDPNRLHANTIYDAFGNSELPNKFNDHNIGPYLIAGVGGLKDQTSHINSYLTNNSVARSLIAKWFNRDADGNFNMNLVAKRGMYDATAMDKVIANSSERGNAMLADAGEELIGKTFVIINDYKYTNKEEVVAKAKKASGWAKVAASYVPGGSTVTSTLDVAETAATVAGKGYVVKTTSYLYHLVWDEEAAAIFYNNYWTDKNNQDPSKVSAFNNANEFKLQLIGFQSAWADVQSTIFTNKSEKDLIRMATIKATDKAIAKLAVKYEEFRTKTPLYSTEPLAAKIGLKEGLEKGDKFEVLEQLITEDGKTEYKRKGVIKVSEVWDNSLSVEEMEELKRQGKLTGNQYTTFKGAGNYYPGMLIKQIK